MNMMKRAWDILALRERRRVLGVFVVIFGSAVAELVGVGSILPFLNILTDPSVIHENRWLSAAYSSFGFQGEMAFLQSAGFVLLGIILATNGIAALSTYIQARFVAEIHHSLATRLTEHYLARPYRFFVDHNSAEIHKNILDESNRVVAGVYRPGIELFSKGLITLGIVAFLAVMEPLITGFILLLVGGVYLGLYLSIRRKLSVLGTERAALNHERYKTVAEAFEGIKATKVAGSEDHFADRFRSVSRPYTDNVAKQGLIAQLPRHLMQALTFGGLMVVLLAMLGSGADLTRIVPVLGMFAFAAYRLMPAMQEILQSSAKFRYNHDIFNEIHSVLSQRPAESKDARIGSGGEVHVARSQAAAPELRFDEAIHLANVTFKYGPDSSPVVSELDLRIKKGEAIAIVGSTGAGKTTIMDMLLGLLEPGQGQLEVDGRRVEGTNQRLWRKRVGYVPQTIYLVDDTIAANIAFGVNRHEIDMEAVQKAARIAHIEEFIVTELDAGYETVVGERGVRLSGGQRQRIGIARALYQDPDVLVLDEATSDIDNVTERNISAAIDELAGAKTLIIVAHRLATVHGCDRIHLLERGKIVASGSFDDLLRNEPRFRELAQIPVTATP